MGSFDFPLPMGLRYGPWGREAPLKSLGSAILNFSAYPLTTFGCYHRQTTREIVVFVYNGILRKTKHKSN